MTDDETFMEAMDKMMETFGNIKDEYGQDVAVECAGTLWAALAEVLTSDGITDVEVVTIQ